MPLASLPSVLILLFAGLIMCAGLAFYFFLEARQVKHYKELFESANRDYKKAQDTIQEIMNQQNEYVLLLERGSQTIELLTNANKTLREDNATLQQSLDYQDEQYKKLINQKKSSEVRTGRIVEQLAPFLQDYPFDPNNARFLGDPLDFVSFNEDKIVFVEVKSGKSQLNKHQREIRDLIQEGKVEFLLYRIEGEDK